jgi:DNA-binding transcriptional MerR regulator
MNWLFHWRNRDQDRLERRIQKLADLYIDLGFEVAEIKTLLRGVKGVEMTPGQQALSTIEEKIVMLARAQEALARQIADLRDFLERQSAQIPSGEIRPGENPPNPSV